MTESHNARDDGQPEPLTADPRPVDTERLARLRNVGHIEVPVLGFSALWNDLNLPDDEFLRLLTNATCPVVCKNVRTDDPPDWHEECEERAREAFRILRGWVKPDV